jgi:release factor glutamine methyltransferase
VIVDRAAAVLAEHGVPMPRVDAEWIVAHALGVGRSELVAQSHEVDEAIVWPLVERRAAREPLAYVLGEWGFRRLVLSCDRRALVPRPETEAVVERCLDLSRNSASGSEPQSPPRALDVGTGTGAIALSLADEAGAAVVAFDSSADALALARENARRTGLEIRLVHGDLRLGLPPGPYDVVVSNPPYVLPEEIHSLEPEVRDWEPREALVDTGQTRALVEAAREVLLPGGRLVLEVHEDRAPAIRDLLAARGYDDVTITRDLAGRERVVDGRWP